MLAIPPLSLYTRGHMKRFITPMIILATVALIINFDMIIVFMLSGFIPGINITLAPSTMIAVFIASTVLIFSLNKRQIVYARCLEFYDYITSASFKFGKKNTSAEPNEKPERPRRRYQEL